MDFGISLAISKFLGIANKEEGGTSHIY